MYIYTTVLTYKKINNYWMTVNVLVYVALITAQQITLFIISICLCIFILSHVALSRIALFT